MLELPSSTSPSTGMRPPAETSTVIPGATLSMGRHSVSPDGARTSAPGADCFSSAATPARARSRIRLSATRPISRKNSSITAASNQASCPRVTVS